MPIGAKMNKIAIIVVDLVPEAKEATSSKIEKEIGRSFQCDWLLKLEKVTVLDARRPIETAKRVEQL
jgi:hypothetical protein